MSFGDIGVPEVVSALFFAFFFKNQDSMDPRIKTMGALADI